jgi:hypothetical protein
MLEGTDLYSAYQPLSDYDYTEFTDQSKENKIIQPEILQTKTQAQMQAQAQAQAQAQMQAQISQQKPIETRQPNFSYDANAFNARYEQEQRIVNQIPKKREEQPQQSYVDKLFSKKRELVKLLQFVFIIVLALSLHSLIEYYLKDYINNNDFSPWRQFFIRLLYPLAALFILWNFKVFVK